MKRTCTTLVLLCFFGSISAGYAEADCVRLSNKDCISTIGCFLTCGSEQKKRCEPYICRPAANECEKVFRQNEPSREKCEAIAGCRYAAAECFCPGPMDCFCGGGPPARCLKE